MVIVLLPSYKKNWTSYIRFYFNKTFLILAFIFDFYLGIHNKSHFIKTLTILIFTNHFKFFNQIYYNVFTFIHDLIYLLIIK